MWVAQGRVEGAIEMIFLLEEKSRCLQDVFKMLSIALALSEEYMVYSRRDAVMDGRCVSAELGLIMFSASRHQIDGICLYDL